MTTAAQKLAAAALLGHAVLALDTPEALELARELPPEQARFPEKLAAAIERHDRLGEAPAPTDLEALVAYAKRVDAAVTKFWDAFEQQEIDGVLIVRKRPVEPAAPVEELAPEIDAESAPVQDGGEQA